MARRAWVLACCLVACSDRELAIIYALPDDTTLVAAMLETETGAYAGGTGLLGAPIDAPLRGLRVEPTEDAAAVRLAMFAALDLALPDPETMARVPVTPASPGDPLLPAARFAVGPIHDDAAHLEASSSPVELTTAWLPRCPVVIPPGSFAFVDVACSDLHCNVPLVQSSCSIDGDLSTCGIEQARLALDGRGRGDSGVCATAERVPEAALSLACSGCRADLYVPPFAPRFDITTAEVLDVEPVDSGDLQGFSHGYLTGLAVLEDRVAVAAHADGRFATPACLPRGPAELRFFDLETMAPSGSATVAPCLMRLTRDRQRRTLFAVFAGETAFSVARIDRDGRVERMVELAEPSPMTHVATGIALTGDGAYLAAAFAGPAQLAMQGRVAVLDPSTLEVSRVLELGSTLMAVTGVNGPQVAVAQGEESITWFIDVARGSISSTVYNASGRDIEQVVRDLAYLPAIDRVLGSGPGPGGPVVHVAAQGPGWIAAAAAYEMRADPTALHAWRPEGNEIAVVAVVGADRQARLARFDVPRARFLPGMEVAGFGAATQMDDDPEGRVWILFPWSAGIARAAPLQR